MKLTIPRLELRTRGYITYLPGSLDNILRGDVDDTKGYAFRMVMSLRTEDLRYAETVNLGLWIGSGVWKGDELIVELSFFLSLCLFFFRVVQLTMAK